MGVQFFIPDDDLSDYLDGLWVQELEADSDNTVSLKVLPGTSAVICVQYRSLVQQDDETTYYRSAITGLQTMSHKYSVHGPVGTVVARFTPWGAATVLHPPMREFSDMHVHMHDVFSLVNVERMEDQVACATSAAQRANILQQFIRVHCNRRADKLVIHASQALRQSGGQISVSALARQIGLSERQLERRFIDQIGISPKTFARILRFQSVVQQRKNGKRWLDAAIDSGYFDQAHLVNDIKSLTGLLPRDFFARPESLIARYFSSAQTGSGFSHACYL